MNYERWIFTITLSICINLPSFVDLVLVPPVSPSYWVLLGSAFRWGVDDFTRRSFFSRSIWSFEGLKYTETLGTDWWLLNTTLRCHSNQSSTRPQRPSASTLWTSGYFGSLSMPWGFNLGWWEMLMGIKLRVISIYFYDELKFLDYNSFRLNI